MRIPIVLFTFFLTTFTLAIDPFTIKGISLSEQNVEIDQEQSLIQRDDPPYPYVWFAIDGSMYDLPDANNFHTAFWTFNSTFLRSIQSQTAEKAQEMLYQATIEYNTILRDECWKFSNESAFYAKPPRRNTLARVASFPSEDPQDEIDPIYNLAAAVKITCFERAKNGDTNQPIKRHTKHLINKLKWDRQTALRKLKRMHKHFPPPTNTNSNSKRRLSKTFI